MQAVHTGGCNKHQAAVGARRLARGPRATRSLGHAVAQAGVFDG